MTTSPGTLRIALTRETAPGTHELHVERTDRRGFDFVGGQYIIVNTGVTLPGGKPAKRAYSLAPSPEIDAGCRLTFKRIGPGSAALAGAPIGTELSFSGPWGKLVSTSDAHARTLFVATDTGITAALGAVERRHPSCEPKSLRVLWLRSGDDTFIELAEARERVERTGAGWAEAELPPLRTPERARAAHALIAASVQEFVPELVLAAGDGDVVYPLRDAPRSAAVRDVRIECFFHNPERKAS